MFGVQGELLYSTLREGWLQDYSHNLNHLLLPVAGKLYLSERFSLDFGPQLGMLLPNNDVGEVRFDFSLGAGLSHTIGRHFDVSIRYNWGLTPVKKGYDEDNNTFRLGLGYRF